MSTTMINANVCCPKTHSTLSTNTKWNKCRWVLVGGKVMSDRCSTGSLFADTWNLEQLKSFLSMNQSQVLRWFSQLSLSHINVQQHERTGAVTHVCTSHSVCPLISTANQHIHILIYPHTVAAGGWGGGGGDRHLRWMSDVKLKGKKKLMRWSPHVVSAATQDNTQQLLWWSRAV